MELLNDLLNQVANLSTGALVVAGVLALGYVIKAIPQVPNSLIPLFTLSAAVALEILVGERGQVDYSVRYPEVRLGLVGVVYWGVGWLIHNQGLSRLEKFLPAPLRGLLGVEAKDEPPKVKDIQMKNNLMLILFAAGLALNCPAATEEEWTWTAPNPALPDTEWYDYGWDSTSNGPASTVAAPQERAAIRPFAPLQFAQIQPSRMPSAPAGPPAPPPVPEKPEVKTGMAYTRPQPGRLYADSFLSLRTLDFTTAEEGYGLGVGYQVNKYWSGELRIAHHGLDAKGSAIQDLGARLVARMPFQFLSPYTFLGASFDLERDAWHLQPGAGIELGVHRSLKGLSIFAEGGLDADLHGRSGYLFSSGVRLRF